MSLATTPFPVPVSPQSKTVLRVGATESTCRKTSCMSGEAVPTMAESRPLIALRKCSSSN